MNEYADPLTEKAIEIFKTTGGRYSVSYLQRRLMIGYNRAARIIEAIKDKERG